MNSKTLMAGLVAAAGLATTASAQVFTAAGVPAAITDNTFTAVDVIVAGGPASIADLNVLLDISHTWDADLDIIIVTPDQRYVRLTTENGGAGDNFTFTRFTQCGAQSVVGGVAPFSGNYIPQGGDATAQWSGPALPAGGFVASLANLNGSNANGTWQLWVYDDAGADEGAVNHLSLEFNGQLDPLGPSAPGGSNPSGTGLATPNTGQPGSTTLLAVSVAPGGCPASTGLTVSANLTALGGSATQAFLDNGTGGDATAGDGVFSYNLTTPASQGGGSFPVAFAISDSQARTGNGSFNYLVSAPPAVFTDLGSLACGVTTRNLSIDAPQEIDWYKMTLPPIADPAGFFDVWTTANSVITNSDTELALFDSNGVLIVADDDDGGGPNGYFSEISFGATNPVRETGGAGWVGGNGRDGSLAGGVYWMAVGGFNMIPANGWLVTSTSIYTGTVEFVTNLQGSCAPNCVADRDDGTGTGTQDGAVNIDDLLFFLVQFEGGLLGADVDNGTATGTTDGAVNIDDLLYFLFRFEEGC